MTGSTTPPAEPVRTAAVVTHGKPEAIGEGLARLERVAREGGVELLLPEDEAEKHDREDARLSDGRPRRSSSAATARCCARSRATSARACPWSGVNFGAVGFLTSITAEELETASRAYSPASTSVVELPTLEVEVGGERHAAINDVVVASSIIGRMIELGWAVGGEDLGAQPCDGVICSTPSGSTGYNLSNGGPVLVWGLEARWSRSSPRTPCTRARSSCRAAATSRSRTAPPTCRRRVLVDGQPVGELAAGERVVVRLGEQSSLLAHLPEATFFRRYRETFAS